MPLAVGVVHEHAGAERLGPRDLLITSYGLLQQDAEAFAAEISAFVDAVEQGKPVPVGFEDGRQALLLAEAAIRSAAEGRTVHTSEIG